MPAEQHTHGCCGGLVGRAGSSSSDLAEATGGLGSDLAGDSGRISGMDSGHSLVAVAGSVRFEFRSVYGIVNIHVFHEDVQAFVSTLRSVNALE